MIASEISCALLPNSRKPFCYTFGLHIYTYIYICTQIIHTSFIFLAGLHDISDVPCFIVGG